MAYVTPLCHHRSSTRPADPACSVAQPQRNINSNSLGARMPLSIGVLQETSAHEARVALTPDIAAKFLELGATVDMQAGAGERSHFPDTLFKGVQFHADP